MHWRPKPSSGKWGISAACAVGGGGAEGAEGAGGAEGEVGWALRVGRWGGRCVCCGWYGSTQPCPEIRGTFVSVSGISLEPAVLR